MVHDCLHINNPQIFKLLCFTVDNFYIIIIEGIITIVLHILWIILCITCHSVRLFSYYPSFRAVEIVNGITYLCV